MKNNPKKIVYVEPEDYFPKEIRQKYKLGEYAEDSVFVKSKSDMHGHEASEVRSVPDEGLKQYRKRHRSNLTKHLFCSIIYFLQTNGIVFV